MFSNSKVPSNWSMIITNDPFLLKMAYTIKTYNARQETNSKISAQELKEVGRGRVDWSQLGTS